MNFNEVKLILLDKITSQNKEIVNIMFIHNKKN
jgi:hypothetical protein